MRVEFKTCPSMACLRSEQSSHVCMQACTSLCELILPHTAALHSRSRACSTQTHALEVTLTIRTGSGACPDAPERFAATCAQDAATHTAPPRTHATCSSEQAS